MSYTTLTCVLTVPAMLPVLSMIDAKNGLSFDSRYFPHPPFEPFQGDQNIMSILLYGVCVCVCTVYAACLELLSRDLQHLNSDDFHSLITSQGGPVINRMIRYMIHTGVIYISVLKTTLSMCV